MISTITHADLTHYLRRQLDNAFPDSKPFMRLPETVAESLDRLERCFAPVKLPGYHSGDQVHFNYLHSDQYATFLYLVANTAWRSGDDTLAQKCFFLNKAMNGMVCMYDTQLPEVFLLIHTTGIVLGKARYGNYLVVRQNVTVGTEGGERPDIGDRVVIYGNSSIVGSCHIGDDAVISLHTTVRNESVPHRHICFGTSPDISVRPIRQRHIDVFFDVPA